MWFDLFAAFILGVIEGLTEFIPVSSTGHLILLGEAIEFSGRRADTFSVFIQLGAILAVVVMYPQKFVNLFRFKDAAGFSGKQGLLKLSVATFPALLMGYLLYDFIKAELFSAQTVAFGLIFGGIVLLLIEKLCSNSEKADFSEISYKNALLVGVFQCFALWPGMSRSGSTIVGGLITGFNKKLAAEFSFFLAVPIMFAAVGYDLLKSWSFLSFNDIPIFAIGFIISFVVALLAIKFFLNFLQAYSLRPLGVYRVLLGVLVLYFIT